MDYQEAMAYIGMIQRTLGSDYSLRDVKELAERMGRPDRNLNVIHVAGTNGKGSVSHDIANILLASGYTVGRYLSPTIFDYREKIQYGGRTKKGDGFQWISEEETAACLTAIRTQCEAMREEGYGQPTAFEMETVMAFCMFAQWKVDVAVIEAGLGGRLDATNIVEHPLQCIFTSISMDHTAFLGNGIAEIAKEKYGIIKHGTQVISLEQEPLKPLLLSVCQKEKAEVSFVDPAQIQQRKSDLEQQSFLFQGNRYTIAQCGIYQAENAALAITSACRLSRMGFDRITQAAIREGLMKSRWKGRFDIVSRNPFLLLDGAHNPDAAECLRQSLEAYFPTVHFLFIIGVFRDKDYRNIIAQLLPIASGIYTVTAPGARGLDSRQLKKTIQDMLACSSKDSNLMDCNRTELSHRIFACDSMQEALERALLPKGAEKTVVCGSLSILGEVYEYLEQGKEKQAEESREKNEDWNKSI